jgi:zinc D-Ala-D-Ala carboxypeptidase
MLMLSEHFSFAELTLTSVRAANVPGPEETAELRRLCATVLEPLRDLYIREVGRAVGPWIVSSGYRCEAVNTAIGGAKNSAHLYGAAADGRALDHAITCFMVMLALLRSEIPFDQLIYEAPASSVWLHVQVRPGGAEPRREALMSLSPGLYLPWNPAMVGEDRRNG